MIKKTVKEITMHDENDTKFIHVVFMDGPEIDLRGPKSGFRYSERTKDSVTLYDCEFKGFELA